MMFDKIYNRIATFAAEGSPTHNVIQMGVDLTKQYLYDNHNKSNEFARYSGYVREDQDGKPLTYAEKNKKFHEALMDDCYKVAGLEDRKDIINAFQAMQRPDFSAHMFSIVSIILDDLMSKTEVEQYLSFAEVRNVAWGDSATFHFGNRGTYQIAKVAHGKNRAFLQREYMSEVTLTPTAHQASVAFPAYEIARGEVDWGYQIAKIRRSFLTDISVTVSDAMFGAYNTLSTPWVFNSYSQTTFTELADRIAAANGVPGCIVYGTRSALGKIIPANQYFGFENGSEYMDQGYVSNPFGIPTVLLQQAVKPNSDFDFVLPNDKLVFLPSAGDKPVKVVIEGETVISEVNENNSASRTRIFTVTMRYDIGIATASKYGIMKVA
jgi:hypothetical protein